MISICYNYSSMDREFLDDIIRESKYVSDDIILTYVDHFFDGTPENQALIDSTHILCNGLGVKVNRIKYDPQITSAYDHKIKVFKYLHNICRLKSSIKTKYDYILFLDGDEVLDGKNMNLWLKSINIYDYTSYSFATYWYFRSKKYRAKTLEDSAILISKKMLNYDTFMNIFERYGMFTGNHLKLVKSLDNQPMLHHYSWAKGDNDEQCKARLLNKVRCWGHSSERDWVGHINKEFSRPFNGTDFVHGYKYDIL